MDEGDRLLQLLLSSMRITRRPLTRELLARSRGAIVEFGLKPMDATVVALSDQLGEIVGERPCVATMDTDFKSVTGLNIWGLG
jgi:hypothetical protein